MFFLKCQFWKMTDTISSAPFPFIYTQKDCPAYIVFLHWFPFFLKIVNHEIAKWQKIVQRKFVQLTLFCSKHFWQTYFKFKFTELFVIHIKWFREHLVRMKCKFYRALKHFNNYFAPIFWEKNIHSLQFYWKCVLTSKQSKATMKWVKLSHHYFNALHL